MDLDEFAVDPDLCENGKRVDLGSETYITVRSSNSERAKAVRERLWKPYSTWKDVPKDILTRLNADWIAQGLLSEMVGFTHNKQPLLLDLTKDADQKRLSLILRDAKYVGFRSRVIGIAIEDGNYQAAGEAAIEGKSATTPAGSSVPEEAQSS